MALGLSIRELKLRYYIVHIDGLEALDHFKTAVGGPYLLTATATTVKRFLVDWESPTAREARLT